MARKQAAPDPAPKAKESETKPWEAMGICRRTYFNRKKAGTLESAVSAVSASVSAEKGASGAASAKAALKIAPEKRPVIGRPIQKGQVLNPTGRPKGSRNKLTQDFVAAMCEDFRQHGAAVVHEVRTSKPDVYLRVIAGLVPAQVEHGEAGAFSEMDDSELDAVIAKMDAQLAMLTRDDDGEHVVH